MLFDLIFPFVRARRPTKPNALMVLERGQTEFPGVITLATTSYCTDPALNFSFPPFSNKYIARLGEGMLGKVYKGVNQYENVVKRWIWFCGPFCPRREFFTRANRRYKTNGSKSRAHSKRGGTGFWLIPNIGTVLPKSFGSSAVISTIPGNGDNHAMSTS